MKKFVFYFILILLPFLFLFAAEGLLRLFDYGESYPLVLKEGNRYRLNPDFPQKYFSQYDLVVPQLPDQTFAARKDSQTVRLICLGGSTTAGFPYEVNINFPYFMQVRLRHLFPHKNIEVVNLGI